MTRKKANNSVHERELIRLWLERPEDKRTGNDVLAFYGWLTQNCPHLLPRVSDDPYQRLKGILNPYVRETPVQYVSEPSTQIPSYADLLRTKKDEYFNLLRMKDELQQKLREVETELEELDSEQRQGAKTPVKPE